jgi:putative membrane protein
VAWGEPKIHWLEQSMKKAKQITALVLAVIIIVVVFQNTEAVQTKVLWATVTMPRALLLFMTLAVGIIIGVLLSLIFAKKWSKNSES